MPSIKIDPSELCNDNDPFLDIQLVVSAIIKIMQSGWPCCSHTKISSVFWVAKTSVYTQNPKNGSSVGFGIGSHIIYLMFMIFFINCFSFKYQRIDSL